MASIRVSTRTRARLYAVHGWTGVLFGLVLFAFSFSGVVALFHHELFQWERPAARQQAGPHVSIDTLLAEHVRPENDHINVFPPRAGQRAWRLVQSAGGEGDEVPPVHERTEHDAATGEVLDTPFDGVARFFRQVHTNLLLEQWGRYTVGVGGLLLLLALLSGIIVHARFTESFTTYRPERSRHVRWLDTHNVIGVWLLPFHVMIAFSGALLGLAGIFISVLAFVVFQGDVEEAQSLLLGEEPEPTNVVAPMASVQSMIVDTDRHAPPGEVVFIDFHHWGDENAVVRISRTVPERLGLGKEFVYRGATGELLEVRDFGDTYAGAVYAAMVPLHYGTFGGPVLKVAYALLGLGLCMLIVSGCYVWIERRRTRAPRASMALERVVPAFTFGMAAATGAALASHHALDTTDMPFWIGAVYFSTWLAVGAAVAMAPAGARSKIGAAAVAAFFALAPIVHGATTGDHLGRSLARGDLWVGLIDLGLLAVAAACALWAVTLRSATAPAGAAEGRAVTHASAPRT